MFRRLVGAVAVATVCLVAPLVDGAPRGGGGRGKEGGAARGGGERPQGGRPGGGAGQGARSGKSLGGQWSEFKPHGGQGAGGLAGKMQGSQGIQSGSAAALSHRQASQQPGGQGAAAGAAAAKRNGSQATGAQGAAAGAAASNRNSPNPTGAQGAAAGAAVANRNSPQFSGAQGAAAGAAVNNRNQPNLSGAGGAAVGYAAARDNFDHPEVFGQGWYGEHPGAWTAASWSAGSTWNPAGWEAVAAACGYNRATAVSYNYGDNVTCLEGNVVVNGQAVGTAEEYGQQAADLAQMGAEAQPPATDQWYPLGVFALVRNADQHPQLVMQLAVNQQGVLRGNYSDTVTGSTQPIQGAVDQNIQRAAWTVGDNQYSVIEAGLTNLTQGEAPALIHKAGKTERWLLVRLQQPADGAGEAAPAAAAAP